MYIINFLSLDLLDKNIINFEENYIQNIFHLLNEKGLNSSNTKVQDLSLDCLCNITFYSKLLCSLSCNVLIWGRKWIWKFNIYEK